MKTIIFGIMIFAVSICGLTALSCNTASPIGTPTIPNITDSTSITATNLSTITTTAPPPGMGTVIFVKAPLTIDKTFDGREINVNQIKFTGSVSSQDNIVMVNSAQATVNNDGNYFAYLNLIPGKNIIEIKTTTNHVTASENVSVFFVQPLVILPNWPSSNDVDYRKSLIIISGIVSDSSAKVEVNNQQATVSANGVFTAQIQLQLREGNNNRINIVASRNGESDNGSMSLDVYKGSLTGPPPGFGSGHIRSHFIFDYPIVALKAGQMTEIDFAYWSDKDNPINGFNNNFTVARVSNLNARDSLPIPESLNININPSKFSVYPKIEYHYQMNINAGSIVIPGDYYFQVSAHFGYPDFSFTLQISK